MRSAKEEAACNILKKTQNAKMLGGDRFRVGAQPLGFDLGWTATPRGEGEGRASARKFKLGIQSKSEQGIPPT